MTGPELRAWIVRWRHLLAYVFLAGACVWVINGIGNVQEAEANHARAATQAQREASIRFCESGNERTVVLRDFILAVAADPDPRQFDFITDPQLRAGALEQQRRSRAEMRDRVTRTFTVRDCAADFPQPPPGG